MEEKKSILPLKFVKIVHENGAKEEVINFGNVIVVHFTQNTILVHFNQNIINYEKKKTKCYYLNVVNLDKFEQDISKFMIKMRDNAYIRDLNDITLMARIDDKQFRMCFTSKIMYIYTLTKSEASALGF